MTIILSPELEAKNAIMGNTLPGGEVIITKSGNHFLYKPYNLLLDGVWNSQVEVLGGVTKNLEVDGPADNNNVTVYGNIGGNLLNDDGWYNTIIVKGKIGDTLEISNSIDTSVTAWSATGVFAHNSQRIEINLGWTDELDFYRVNDSNATIGWLEEGWVKGDGNKLAFGGIEDYFNVNGNSNEVSVGYAFDAEIEIEGNFNHLDLGYAPRAKVEVDEGLGTSIEVDNADGAVIAIQEEAADTSIFTKKGDGSLYDQGHNTKAKFGSGNDDVEAAGTGTALYDGGSGFDVLVDKSSADIVADHFEWVNISNLQGNTTFFSNPLGGLVQIGQSNINLADVVQIFGHNDGQNNAVVDYNGGSLIIVGAANDYGLHQPVEDFMFV